MEAMGKKMVTYCGGLPLAVKVLGGLLAGKHTIPEWQKVYDNIGPYIVGGSGLDDKNLNSVYRVLCLSYEDLPVCLKHCFLSLACFPEDYRVNVETLFSYWAAEGITTLSLGGATIRDSAEGYLEELVRRNMVLADKNYATWRFDYCHLHDIMRGVCLSKAEEENFLRILVKAPTSTSSTINGQSRCRSRRLALHSGNALQMLGHKCNPKMRSFLFFGDEEEAWIQSSISFGSLPLLRVLDLSRVKFEGGKLPCSIGELIHLRFLSLYEASVTHLPYSLRKLKLLLYLNLHVDDDAESVHVPNVLKEMKELRYLFLPYRMHVNTKLKLRDLVNLETLRCFSTEHTCVTDLLCMNKLRNLAISFHDGCTFQTLTSTLGELRDLQQLCLYDFMHGTRVADGGDFIQFVHLKVLALGMRMRKLPDEIRFPPSFAHILLQFCYMEEDPMPVLEKLLHLKWVELLSHAFSGRRMVCSRGGFPQLRVLKLYKQMEVEEWIVEEGSMPCLRTLSIIGCRMLKEAPDGLKYVTSLKELNIELMKKEWTVKLSQGGEDYYKVQHIPRVQFLRCEEE